MWLKYVLGGHAGAHFHRSDTSYLGWKRQATSQTLLLKRLTSVSFPPFCFPQEKSFMSEEKSFYVCLLF